MGQLSRLESLALGKKRASESESESERGRERGRERARGSGGELTDRQTDRRFLALSDMTYQSTTNLPLYRLRSHS
eukprot:192851-Hanusia_phi.AAC.2